MDWELICWVVVGALGLIGFGLLLLKARRDSIYYVEWVGDLRD